MLISKRQLRKGALRFLSFFQLLRFNLKLWLDRKNQKRDPRQFHSFGHFVFIGASLGIILLVFYAWLPRAFITLDVQGRPFAYRFSFVLADKESSGIVGSNVFYGRFVEVNEEGERSFQVTGQKNVGARAEGEITVENYSGSRQSLVAGTRFLSDSGLVFRSQMDIFLPPARVGAGGEIKPGRIKAEVVADEGGAAGNIPPGQFSLPGLSKDMVGLIKAHSDKAFANGQDDLRKVISEEDVEHAQELAGKELFVQAEKKLRSRVRRGEEILPGLIQEEVTELLPSGVEGDERDELVVRAKVRSWTIVVPKGIFDANLGVSLEEVLPEGKIITPETRENIILETALASLKVRFIEFSVVVDGMIANDFSSLDFKRSLMGKSAEEANELLRRKPGVISSKVCLWPFWVKRVPRLSSHLKLRVRYLAT